MKNCCNNENCECCKVNMNKYGRRQMTQGGNAVYGLGFIGAVIFFISQAPDFWAGVVGILKAIVWPALMVYEAFKFLIK